MNDDEGTNGDMNGDTEEDEEDGGAAPAPSTGSTLPKLDTNAIVIARINQMACAWAA